MSSGNYLKSLRESKKITQTQLAKEIGTSEDYVSKLERNICRPSTNFIIKYSKFFDVRLEEIFLKTLRPFHSSQLD